MKKTKLALAITTAVFASSALATNGDNMIGTGAHEIAMGGTGVTGIHGAEGVLINPASIGGIQGTEFNIGGTLFMPTIKNETPTSPAGTDELTSAGDTYIIPSVSTATRINENLTFGLGMWGTSGMGVDYSKETGGTAGSLKASSNLQILKFAPSLTYNKDNFAIGFAPVLQYGALDIDHDQTAFSGFGSPNKGVGTGASSDLGWGYMIGGTYKTGNLVLGASYDSAIDMKYDGQISTQLDSFSWLGVSAFTNDHLEQPAQIKVGASYLMGNITLSADFKQIRWSEAKGYKQFGWEDQNVIALGAKYDTDKFWIGAGYNRGDTPVDEQDAAAAGQAGIDNSAKNFFNLTFFPATSEQHFTLGGGYKLNNNLSVDLAVAYSPETEETFKTTSLAGGAFGDVTTKHSELSYTAQMSYKF
ncbi:MAG: outer membrane protein transport protein [Gammaproteobacteria bacterium]|nr:outer membrane protein transport protein [Gammaproteobacteria bacterium]